MGKFCLAVTHFNTSWQNGAYDRMSRKPLPDPVSRKPLPPAFETWACMYSLPLLPSIYRQPPGSVSHFAKTWVSLHTTTYKNQGVCKNKNTKYFDILLLLTCEEVLHALTVQIWAQNSTILTPNNLLIVCHSSITNWSQIFFQKWR